MRPETEAWVTHAEIDFRMTERAAISSDPIYVGVCFHSQQCIEKYLKAMLEEAERPIPRTHDLAVLFELTADQLPDLSSLRRRIEAISQYAIVTRYPGWESSVEDLAAEAEAASTTMVAVRRIIRGALGLPMPSQSND